MVTKNGAKSNIGNGSISNDATFDSPGFNLFEETFGKKKEDMLPTLTATTTQSQVDSKLTATSITSDKVIYYVGDLNYSGANSFCGSGILIVTGSLKINKVCDTGFEGFIYVMGDLDQKGTAKFTGAVVVEGNSQTSVGSSGGNNKDVGKIEYNAEAVLQYGYLLSPPTFEVIQGTWRQR